MAERFARGGRLLALGRTPAARSDARHVAVEFVHPVIVGKRALPAIALAGEGGPLHAQLDLIAEPGDMVIAFGAEDGCGETAAALELAARRGCLTIAFAPGAAEWVFEPPGDPFVRQELGETLYHVLWELVHVFFEHRGLLEGRPAVAVHDTGASSFLYPFLAEQEDDLEAVVADVRASVLVKGRETTALRVDTIGRHADVLGAAAADLRAGFARGGRLLALGDGGGGRAGGGAGGGARGGRLLALGNGGSATDAMDAVADFRTPLAGGPARPALDLTEDTAIITALANDIGPDVVFARQVIAHGRTGDLLLALSTSGASRSVLAALAEARRRGMRTIAMVGYDGGRIAGEGLADHVIVARSEHIPRIQEAHAGAYHVLRELVERA